MQILKASCTECSNDALDEQSFSCFEESPSFLTYRARLEGTSDTDSSSLVSQIEAWVRGGGASVIVTGVLMTVDSHCSVAISSLGQPECSPITTPFMAPSNSPSPTSHITVASTQSCACTPAIIRGAVAIVIVIITTTTIIALVLKNRPYTIKNTLMEGTAIPTTTNTAYGNTKRKPEGIGSAPTISLSSDTGPIEEEKMYEMIPGEDK